MTTDPVGPDRASVVAELRRVAESYERNLPHAGSARIAALYRTALADVEAMGALEAWAEKDDVPEMGNGREGYYVQRVTFYRCGDTEVTTLGRSRESLADAILAASRSTGDNANG